MKKHSSVTVIASMAALGALSFLLVGCSKPAPPPVDKAKAAAGYPTTDPQYLNRPQFGGGGGAPRSGGH